MPPDEDQATPVMRWHDSNSPGNGDTTTSDSMEVNQVASAEATPPLPRHWGGDDFVPPPCPEAQTLEQREESAEEIMEASLSFRQQSMSTISRWLGSSTGELYPRPTSFDNDVDNTNVVAIQPGRQLPAVRVSDNTHESEGINSTAAEIEPSFIPSEADPVNINTETALATISVENASIEHIDPYVAVASIDNNDLGLAEASISLDDDEEEMMAYKRAAAGYSMGIGPFPSRGASSSATNTTSSADDEAVVVGITEHDVHPSDLSHDDARAEFIGQDFSRSVDLPGTAAIALEPVSNSYESYLNGFHATPGEAVLNDFNATPGEAVTLESNVLEYTEARTAWSSQYSEEAYVLEDTTSSLLDRKPPALENGADDQWLVCNLQQDAGIVVAEEEAEVVGITEDVHPSEMTGESVAEFVGSSFNVAMAFETGADENHVATEQATIVGISAVNSSDADDTLASSVVPDEYSSSVVALPVLSGSAVPPDQETISEAHVLPDYSMPLRDTTSGSMTMDSESNWKASQSSTTLSEPSMTLSETERFVINSSGDFEDVRASVAATHVIEENGERTPVPRPFRPISQRDASAASTADSSNVSRNRSDGSASQLSSLQALSSNLARSTNTVIEKLFGDTPPPGRRRDFEEGDDGRNIHPRTLLPWSVFRNESTRMWVVTLNTNQKALDSNNVTEASKALKAFSVPTEKQAMALARSWASPRMLPFQDNPSCFTCETRFAVFRRACHCRNCGVCICSRCAIQWPSKMIPETYNIKRESIVNICRACDWLCTGFRLALLEGDFDHAVALHATGNVNLVTPFANVKGELFYPVHCAVLGGSLELLKWLVDENCCPLRSIRISGKNRDSSSSFTPILTSRGRSLLSISMEMTLVPIVRYLVVEKGMSISAERNVTVDTITNTLNLVLRLLPENIQERQSNLPELPPARGVAVDDVAHVTSSDQETLIIPPDLSSDHPTQQPPSPIPPPGVASQHLEAIYGRASFEDETSDDMCIICFSNRIDCVVTPCGHQICCLQCSNNISRCPVCSVECAFMRVFKA